MLHNKFWQGFFALAPVILLFVAMIGYFIFIFSLLGNIDEIESSGNDSASYIFGGIGVFFIAIIFVALISIGSLIFYIMHAVQNQNLKDNNLLIVWILLFVMLSGLGQLIYWIVEIIAKRKTVEASKTNLQ